MTNHFALFLCHPDISDAPCQGRNQNEQALSHYEMAMRDHVPGTRGDHEALCRAGIARCSIRMGDLARGMQIALELNDPAVCRECAQVLAKMKQYVEARPITTHTKKRKNQQINASIKKCVFFHVFRFPLQWPGRVI